VDLRKAGGGGKWVLTPEVEEEGDGMEVDEEGGGRASKKPYVLFFPLV
jgi:hypothetical protein